MLRHLKCYRVGKKHELLTSLIRSLASRPKQAAVIEATLQELCHV